MARALLMALACTAVTATRYVDYGGEKMPEYGPAGDYENGRHSEDYHGHSPDAPASLDYKYEDQRNSELIGKELDDTSSWSKSERHQKELMKSLEDSLLDDQDEGHKSRISHRNRKRRPKLRDEDEMLTRRAMKHSRDRKSKSNSKRKDFSEIDRDNFPVDKSKDFEEEISDTTIRVRRRKPRDRSNRGYDSEMERVDELERQINSDIEKEDLPPVIRLQRPPQRSSQRLHNADRFKPSVDDGEEMKSETRHGIPKEYDNYVEYYDTKRLNSIKEKLPSLLHRRTTVYSLTSAEIPEWSNTKRLLQNRRRLDDITEPPESGRQEPLYQDSNEFSESKLSSSISLTPTKMDTTTSITTTTPQTESTTVPAVEATKSREMSIAEKSRLSILKKAQRKEGVYAESTQKPPVLLQMRNRLHTVVMVEPPSSHKPWERVRDVGADTPEHLERAKALMRRKLVSEAKDIHELTDNWDEMICDYIDTTLLESSGSVHCMTISTVMLVVLLCL